MSPSSMHFGIAPKAELDDDTGTVFLEKLSMARGAWEHKDRTFKTAEEREEYLKTMTDMHEKYAGLEQKISRMTEKTWDTNRELAEIEHSIRERFDQKIVRGSRARDSSRDAVRSLLSKKLLSPQSIYISVEEHRHK